MYVWFPLWEDPWSRKWQPTPVFLPGKFHGQRSWWTTVHGRKELPMAEHYYYTSYQNSNVCIKVVIYKLYQSNKNPNQIKPLYSMSNLHEVQRQKSILHVITKIQSAKSRQWETLRTNNTVYSTKRLMGEKKSQYLRAN